MIEVALQLVALAPVPLKLTVEVPCAAPKFAPVITTDVPTGPAAEASTRAVGNHYLIRNMLRRCGAPSFEALQSLCQVLGLEFYIGPPRGSALPKPSLQPEDPPDWVAAIRSEILQALRPEYARLFEDQVGVRHLKTLIGSGADRLDPEEIGRVPFRKSWLLHHGIDPAQCYMVKVMGEAMAPTLPEGCLVLVNPGGKDRENNRIYLVRSSKGLVARRVKKGSNGGQVMVADNPALDHHLWPPDEDVLGELVWMARCLRGKAAEAGVNPWESDWQTGQPVEGSSGYLHRSDQERPGEVSGKSLLP